MPAPQPPAWRLRRRPCPRADGQQRWDRAYQQLLQWTHPCRSSQPSQPPNRSLSGQEQENEKEKDSHDGRPVCACLDPASDPHPND